MLSQKKIEGIPLEFSPSQQPRAIALQETPDNTEDDADYTKTPKKSLLTTLMDKDWFKQQALTESERKLLEQQTCYQTPNGPLVVFDPFNVRPVCKVSADRSVVISPAGSIDSKEHIDNLLNGALIFKTTSKPGDIDSVHANNETSQLMMAKAAELAGLKIANPPDPDKTLDKINPGLARKMEEEWAALRTPPQPAATASATRDYSRSVSGLVILPSSLDVAPPLSAAFADASPGILPTVPAGPPLPAPAAAKPASAPQP